MAENEDYTVFTSRFAGLFHRVICDEGHRLKNCRTLNSIAIDKLYAPKKWVVTATPMMNRILDLLGYLYLFWQPQWESNLDSLDAFVLPSDPEMVYRQSTLLQWMTQCEKYQKKYKDWPLFLFNPRTFAALINRGKLDSATTTSLVLRPILSRIQLRWTMASQIWLDNSEYYLPGVNVPIFHIAGVELRPSRWEASEFVKIWSTFSKHLVKGGSETGKPTKKPTISAGGLRDMAIHRHLCLATFDIRFNTLLLRRKGQGAAQAREWTDNADDHGFSDYFYATRPSPSLPNYLDRLGACAYHAGESVKLRYLAKHVHMSMFGDENGNFKGKTVFMVNWPHTQWGPDAFLYNLGVGYYVIWPDTIAAERSSILAKWNDPTDPVLFLLLNSRSSALGLNIQGACHKLVIFDMPDNINTVVQMIGRIHRLGQEHVQYVWTVCVLGTYDQWLYSNATAKMLGQLAGEAHMENRVVDAEARERMLLATKNLSGHDAHKLIKDIRDSSYIQQAEEYIRKLLGQRCSRLDWRNKTLEIPLKRIDDRAPPPQTPTKHKDGPTLFISDPDSADELLRRGTTLNWDEVTARYDPETQKFYQTATDNEIDPKSTWVFCPETGYLMDPNSPFLYDPNIDTWVSPEDGEAITRVALVPCYNFGYEDPYLPLVRAKAKAGGDVGSANDAPRDPSPVEGERSIDGDDVGPANDAPRESSPAEGDIHMKGDDLRSANDTQRDSSMEETEITEEGDDVGFSSPETTVVGPEDIGMKLDQMELD
ncbi:uncharacterized protein Z519_12390 [Cladophialophora bantiana CBS 173.52]|uniref:Helicase C-terminal domain-containing protein n=1 Tax=Cladophialophora bantiana (strain ATCC 10958 / CBS 173.52 / CDC B-1940 / NIH 8579) TaxID=1442370 RepID=A0A0D2H7T9_CLAB1|nr:uncharacterized protein Z519_12390 [Cladophialophora bantiana CBS 173.52]KIW86925.1 hypothetical protein Z519_12390 [Cladophialophora bantiana CBS 173.52]